METKTDFDKFLEESQEVKDYLKQFDKKRLDLHEVNLMRITWEGCWEHRNAVDEQLRNVLR